MTIARLTALMAFALVAGCGGLAESRLNPLNWFGGSESRVVLYPDGGFAEPADRRGLVDQVTSLAVEPVIGGAVIHAAGLPPVQGFWDGELVSTTDMVPENGVLVLEFRIRPPLQPTAVSTERSREVVVGLFVSRQKLDGVREIRVVAARNLRTVRR